MFEINGIIYASNPATELIRVANVKVLGDFRLLLNFTNGFERVYDAKPLLEKGVFKKLADESFFKQAKLINGTVAWNDDLEINPDELYQNSISLPMLQGIV